MTKWFLVAGVCLAPLEASAWRSFNRQEVVPVSQGVIEVIGDPGAGPAQYWCSAGDYALRQLRARANQRIYIARGVGPSQTRPGRKAVQFTFSPPADVDTQRQGYGLSMKQVGRNLRAASARQYCYESDRDDFIWTLPGGG